MLAPILATPEKKLPEKKEIKNKQTIQINVFRSPRP